MNQTKHQHAPQLTAAPRCSAPSTKPSDDWYISVFSLQVGSPSARYTPGSGRRVSGEVGTESLQGALWWLHQVRTRIWHTWSYSALFIIFGRWVEARCFIVVSMLKRPKIEFGFKSEQCALFPLMPRQLATLTAVLYAGTHRHANRNTVQANEKEERAKRASGWLAWKQQSPQCSPHINTHRRRRTDLQVFLLPAPGAAKQSGDYYLKWTAH